MSKQKFSVGDTVVCVGSRGYYLTTGKQYEVIGWEPETYHPDAGGFTFPAYVHILDDGGKRVSCHAWRFEKV